MQQATRPRLTKVPSTDQRWEAMKAARANISADDAVQQTAYLQGLFRTMWTNPMAASPVELYEVLRQLSKKKSPLS